MPLDFLIKNDEYLLACDELYHSQNSIISFQEYSIWLKRHYNLFKTFNYPPIIEKEQNSFYFLYNRINQLKYFLQYKKNVKRALFDYETNGIQNDRYINKWLNKYQDLGMALLLFDENIVSVDQSGLKNYFSIKELKFNAIDFKVIIEFKTIFDSIYWKRFDK